MAFDVGIATGKRAEELVWNDVENGKPPTPFRSSQAPRAAEAA